MSLWDHVYAHPDDDAPRRVLADSLLERGDVRGELISIQCELARVPDDERTERQLQLAAREKELLDLHGLEWLGPWPTELVPQFERGFPFHQRGRAAELGVWLPELVRKAPTLRAVTLTDDDPQRWSRDFWLFSEAAQPLWLRRLTLPVTFRPSDARAVDALQVPELSFSGWLGDEGARALKSCRALTLEFDVGVTDFSVFEGLTTFINRGNPMNVSRPLWPDLERFTVDRVEWRGHPAQWWPKLQRLDVYDAKLGRRGVHALLAAGHPTVKRLGIRKEPLDAEAVALLERWPALEVLDVDGPLPDSPVVKRLRTPSPLAGRGPG